MLNFEDVNAQIATIKETQKKIYDTKLKCATEICTLMNELIDKLHSIGIIINMDENPSDWEVNKYQVESNGYNNIVLCPIIISKSDM